MGEYTQLTRDIVHPFARNNPQWIARERYQRWVLFIKSISCSTEVVLQIIGEALTVSLRSVICRWDGVCEVRRQEVFIAARK